MRKAWTLLVLSVLIAGMGIFVSSQDAAASFHIMRVWEVMGGANGDTNIQYVELRMPVGGQNLIATHEVCFFDDTGVPKVRMEFTANALNGPTGVHSILLGTAAFDAAWAAGSPDFEFGGAGSTMTSLNGGIVTRPVQVPGGKVGFGDYDANCSDLGNIDSVAYGMTGSVTADYGTKLAADLPITGTQAIKYKDTIPFCHPNQFILCPRSNNADYTVVDANTPSGNNPRNNVPQSGPVVILGADADGDGYTSTAEASIGTNPLVRCGVGAEVGPSAAWPSDFVSGGIFDSTDQVDIADLNSFLSPRRLDTIPGDPTFSARWDLQPGAGIFGPAWINIADLSALLGGTTGSPPMFGSMAFDGPTCTD